MVRFWLLNPPTMMNNHFFLCQLKKITLLLVVLFLLLQCSDEEIISEQPADDPVISASSVSICTSCTYTVPANTNVVDGKTLGLKPGSVICLNAAYAYTTLLFRNIQGT